MQPEKPIEIDGGIGCTPPRLRNRDRRPHAIVIRLRKRNDDVESVRRPALKQHHKLLLVRHRCRRHRALQKRRHRAEPNHGDSPLLQKISPRKPQPSHALATSMTHVTPHLECGGLAAAFTSFAQLPLAPRKQLWSSRSLRAFRRKSGSKSPALHT